MTNRFKPESGLVIVRADLSGPAGAAVLRLALDTGATQSVVSSAILVSVGYDPAASTDRVQVTTGSGIEFAPRVVVSAITAINRNVIDFSVLALTLPQAPASTDCLAWIFSAVASSGLTFGMALLPVRRPSWP